MRRIHNQNFLWDLWISWERGSQVPCDYPTLPWTMDLDIKCPLRPLGSLFFVKTNDLAIWTQTPLLGEPCVFRTSRWFLNCYSVALFVPSCSFVPCCSVWAIFVHKRHWATNSDPVLAIFGHRRHWATKCDPVLAIFVHWRHLAMNFDPVLLNKLLKSIFLEKIIGDPGHGIRVQMLSWKILQWQFESVLDVPRNLSLKFHQNRFS